MASSETGFMKGLLSSFHGSDYTGDYRSRFEATGKTLEHSGLAVSYVKFKKISKVTEKGKDVHGDEST